mmetsp:Transcript_10312/g.11191  ORF Transcript_10312/g.11191 Transcript_10312/m.11191 type:complete len:165 (+) Transcript_10312:326-820(+)
MEVRLPKFSQNLVIVLITHVFPMSRAQKSDDSSGGSKLDPHEIALLIIFGLMVFVIPCYCAKTRKWARDRQRDLQKQRELEESKLDSHSEVLDGKDEHVLDQESHVDTKEINIELHESEGPIGRSRSLKRKTSPGIDGKKATFQEDVYQGVSQHKGSIGEESDF